MPHLSPLQALVVAGLSVETALVQTSFSGTITLGSIILGILVLIAAGFFTIRTNVAKVWREEAEGQKERADRLQEQLDAEREVRHGLKSELAASEAMLTAERAKPDLSVVATAQAQMMEVLTQLAAASARADTTDSKLEQIHELVNSRLDEALARLDAALSEIASLKEQLGHAEAHTAPQPGGS